MNLLLERTFENRGYDSDFFDKLVSVGHAFPDRIDDMCRLLDVYRKEQKLLVLFTDFDFDGISCGTLGYAAFSEFGFHTVLWLPDVSWGYGFSRQSVDAILDQYPNASGILTADVGIGAFDGVSYARSKGLDVFVTDHHLPKKSAVSPDGVRLPDACSVVDSYLSDPDSSFPEICGSYVLYQVLRYYAEYYMDSPGYYIQQVERLRVLAGLGTLSDGMPLYHENRFLVRDTVSFLRFLWCDGTGDMLQYIPGCNVYRSVFYGLYRILDTFFGMGKFQDYHGIDETFLSFYLTPAFNSIKRMCGDITDAYGAFFFGEEQSRECISNIMELTELRKEKTEEAFAILHDSVQPWAPYLYVTEAASGLRGLLAQKMMAETGEPVLVVGRSEDGYSGSGRTPSWYSFLKYGIPDGPCGWWAAGHPNAFGFGVSDEACIDELIRHLKRTIAEHRPPDEAIEFVPDYLISTVGEGDTDINCELFQDFLYELETCRPFGSGFPEPTGMIRFSKRDVEEFRVMGHNHEHIKMTLEKGLTVICFFQSDLFPQSRDHKVIEDLAPDVIEVTGKLGFNRFRGVTSVQFVGSIANLSDAEPRLDSGVFGDLLDAILNERKEKMTYEMEEMDF